MKKPSLTRTFLLAACSVAPVFCQISQDHPELCGDKAKTVAVPPGISATAKSNVTATLHLSANRSVEIRGVNHEIQVCLAAANKLVSFGLYVGYDANIVDLVRGAVVDYLVAYDPIISPDHRWIASRRFQPPRSEITVSEEYLLYDLNAGPASNRHNVTPYATDAVGWAMYPAFTGYAPADLRDIPEASTRAWRSKSFFWAPDSQSLAFADSVGQNLSVVLVLIKDDKPQAYTYSVSAADICAGARPGDLTLEDASINSVPGGVPNVLARFGSSSGCQTRPLNLTFDDFHPARVEVYEHRKLKKSTPIIISSPG
jgi:hypothetical protein